MIRHGGVISPVALFVGLVMGGCTRPPQPDPVPPAATATITPTPDHDGIREAAREIMAAARYATLGTLGPDGNPQARVVDPFAPDSNFVVMVATNARSRKTAEIATNPQVSLLYFDAAGGSYVTVIGRAELVGDPAIKAQWWKEEWAAFYQDRNLGDDYLLIRVRPTRLEISSERHGIRNDSLTWRPTLIAIP
ncbi:MAG: pyridoxamine 5'-phosphate oxidase family protein [Gemmatimonadota bacterium]|nr:pyridoxamine 5'-phosphate oxidase family protein [Gemmatimonadota bacterium]